MKVDLDEISAWEQASNTQSVMMPRTLVNFMIKELRAARKVVEAARENLVIIYGPELQAEQPCKLLKALKDLDGGI